MNINVKKYIEADISDACSYIGQKIILGNTTAVKQIYINLSKENPALIKLFSQLQECLTTVEIANDTEIYNDEFLYYWGMSNLGETSNLIFKDLGTAETCFKKVRKKVPKAEARLAFIELLKSDEPAQSELNVNRIDKLRQWAGKGDFFSMIILSKIVFFSFLEEGQTEMPVKALRLLETPCRAGHPVAIRFYNEMLAFQNNMTVSDISNDFKVNPFILYDF